MSDKAAMVAAAAAVSGGECEPVNTPTQLLPRTDKKLDFVRASSAPRRIKHLHFGIFTPTEVTRASQIEVANPMIYNPNDRSVIRGGALDPRLGAIDKDSVCETCGEKITTCVGHFGFIRLCLPVFHPGFFKATLQILQVICKGCARVLVDENDRENYIKALRNPRISARSHVRGALFREVWEKAKKVKICRFCLSENGTVKKAGPLRIVHYPAGNKPPAKRRDEDDEMELDAMDDLPECDPIFTTATSASEDLRRHIKKAADDLNPMRVLDLFERIPSEDVQLLDMHPEIGRPERLIITHLPLPPLCVRPTVCADPSAGSTEDDLTMKASDICQTNLAIQSEMDRGGAANALFELWDALQYEVTRYINSDTPGLPNIPGDKPLRGVAQRLKGKAGRFRGNLSGKRVDFSGRTVISPDPNLGIDQVGIPVHVAKILTFPEKVTEFNIEMLRVAVRNGPKVHPGANFIETKERGRRFLQYGDRKRMANELKIGTLVERHLINGDIVLFNRQPSLHRISIMAHRVRVGNHRTFRFNECVCAPYNADFDGDEMNLHVPQTQEARAEALELMSVTQNLVTPRNGEPIVAAIQDFITASYLITSKNMFMDRAEFFQVVCMMSKGNEKFELPAPSIIKPVELWSGKQVFTTLIRNAALRGDLHSAMEKKRDSYFASLITDVKEKGYKDTPGLEPSMDPRDAFVVFRNGELVSGQVGKKSLGSGSKNSILYILQTEYGTDAAAHAMNRLARLGARWLAQVGFSIGVDDVMPSEKLRSAKNDLVNEGYLKCKGFMQQMKDGSLIPRPGCTADETLEAQLNAELSGIREKAGTACISEIDPTTNAALTMALSGSKGSTINISQMVSCVGQQTVGGTRAPDGFFGRSLPHFQLGLQAKSPVAKGFVSNSFFSGMTPTEFFFHTMGGREGLVDTAVKTAETGYMQRRLMKALEDLAIQYDGTVRTSDGKVVQMRYGDDGLDPALMEADDGRPVSYKRLLETVKASHVHGNELSCSELKRYADEACVREKASLESRGLEENKGFPYVLDKTKEFLQDIARKSECTDLNRRQVDAFFRAVKRKLARGEVEPGTAVGAIGAQSIGEPGTQMTLKTFHFAGVASMNITQGVPRLKEIINASKTIATPVITAALTNDRDEKSARIVKGRVERTFLGEVSTHIKEVYRSGSSYISVRLDMELITKLGLEVDLRHTALSITEHTFNRLKVTPDDVLVVPPDMLRITARPRGDAWKAAAKEGKPSREARKKIASNKPFYLLQALKDQLPRVAVQGVRGVGRAVINQLDDGSYNLLVESAELTNVMAVPGIDGTKVTSNHVMAVLKTLGIEAARATIMHEISTTMQAHGMTIDERHVKLLADCMTSTGTVNGITRFGIQKMKSSTLMLASFETAVEHLFHAAVHCKKDEVVGVSERIIMGLPIPLGTGLFEMNRKHTPSSIVENRKKTLLSDNIPVIANKYISGELTLEA